MATYDYVCKLSMKIEMKVIADRKRDKSFSLNALVNKLLDEHYQIKPEDPLNQVKP